VSERQGQNGELIENRHGDEVVIITLADTYERRRYDAQAEAWVTVDSWPIVFESWGTLPVIAGALLPQGKVHAVGSRSR
jgi:hypothetical protein